VGSQLYIFPNPFDHAQIKHFPPPILLVLIIGHDHTSQPTPIFSTRLQFPPKILCLTYGCQFINQGLTHHQCSCQTFNSSHLNPCDHPSSIPFFIPTSLALAWTWVSTLNVFGSFHLGLCCPWLDNHIPTILRCDVQVAFRIPLDKLAQDPYNVATWHLFLLLLQWCFILPCYGEVTRHKEMDWTQMLFSRWLGKLAIRGFFLWAQALLASSSSIPFPQHEPLTHKHSLHSLAFKRVWEYFRIVRALEPFSIAATSFDTTSGITTLHPKLDGYFPLFLKDYEPE